MVCHGVAPVYVQRRGFSCRQDLIFDGIDHLPSIPFSSACLARIDVGDAHALIHVAHHLTHADNSPVRPNNAEIPDASPDRFPVQLVLQVTVDQKMLHARADFVQIVLSCRLNLRR